MTGLTDRYIAALKPPKKKRLTISDRGTSGVRDLHLMVNIGGSKVFYFRYRTPSGKQKRIKIGTYPATSLIKARQKAISYQMEIDNGNEPSNDNAMSVLKKRKYHTISGLWNDYHQDALTRKKSAIDEKRMWHKHLEHHFRNMDMRKFTREAVLDFIIPYRKNHSPSLSAKIQAILSILGTYAVEQRAVEFSPVYRLGKQQALPTCDRYLKRDELASLWNALSDIGTLQAATVSPSLALSLKLALYTCARRTEIAGMEWGEIDFTEKVWILPAGRTKNGRAHVIPLSAEAISIIKACKSVLRRPNSRFLFPGRRTEAATIGAGHIRGDALTRACARLCKVLKKTKNVEEFSPHDLRRTGATYMASSLKVERFVISQILNHTSDRGGGAAITSVYANMIIWERKGTLLIFGLNSYYPIQNNIPYLCIA